MGSKGANTEFQAVLLAGGSGNRMYPLPEKTAKCLLPVGNRPLISYQLAMLQDAGLEDCLVLTTQSIADQVGEYLESKYDGKMRCSLHVVDDYTGTADALRQISERITTDFIVVSSDVITDVKLLFMADTHRACDAVATFLLTHLVDVDVTDKKGKKEQPLNECNFIGLEHGTDRVLLYRAKADVEETLRVSKKLLSEHPRMSLHSQLDDAHIYIFAHHVIDELKREKNISSIQNELIPHLVAKQFSKSPKKGPEAKDGKDSSSSGGLIKKKFSHAAALAMSSVPPQSFDAVQCLAHIPEDRCFCMRVNTVPAYKRANREVGNQHDGNGKPLVVKGYQPETGLAKAPSGGKKQKLPFNVGKDCVIGQGVQIGAKSNIKKSVVGSYCKIGSKCRISNCVLMDHVIIEDQVTLSDTIVCSNAHIQKNSSLDTCEVGANFTIQQKTKSKKEQFSTANIMEAHM